MKIVASLTEPSDSGTFFRVYTESPKRKYDLSFAPDPLTGNYPVQEEVLIRRLDRKKSVELSTDTLSRSENLYNYREFRKDSRENMTLETKKSEKRESVARRYVWVILLVVALGIGLYLLLYKDILSR